MRVTWEEDEDVDAPGSNESGVGAGVAGNEPVTPAGSAPGAKGMSGRRRWRRFEESSSRLSSPRDENCVPNSPSAAAAVDDSVGGGAGAMGRGTAAHFSHPSETPQQLLRNHPQHPEDAGRSPQQTPKQQGRAPAAQSSGSPSTRFNRMAPSTACTEWSAQKPSSPPCAPASRAAGDWCSPRDEVASSSSGSRPVCSVRAIVDEKYVLL